MILFFQMPKRDSEITRTVAKNLNLIMKHHQLSPESVANMIPGKSVSSRHIRFILNQESNPTIEVVDTIAKAFGLEGWQLMKDGLASEGKSFEGIKNINEILENYLKVSEPTKGYVSDILNHELSRKQEGD